MHTKDIVRRKDGNVVERTYSDRAGGVRDTARFARAYEVRGVQWEIRRSCRVQRLEGSRSREGQSAVPCLAPTETGIYSRCLSVLLPMLS
jgi:hypothetical protein